MGKWSTSGGDQLKVFYCINMAAVCLNQIIIVSDTKRKDVPFIHIKMEENDGSEYWGQIILKEEVKKEEEKPPGTCNCKCRSTCRRNVDYRKKIRDNL